jgi:hypothetical protein
LVESQIDAERVGEQTKVRDSAVGDASSSRMAHRTESQHAWRCVAALRHHLAVEVLALGRRDDLKQRAIDVLDEVVGFGNDCSRGLNSPVTTTLVQPIVQCG